MILRSATYSCHDVLETQRVPIRGDFGQDTDGLAHGWRERNNSTHPLDLRIARHRGCCRAAESLRTSCRRTTSATIASMVPPGAGASLASGPDSTPRGRRPWRLIESPALSRTAHEPNISRNIERGGQ
jgi:hypothetical protein